MSNTVAPLRWAVLGTGVVSGKFVQGLRVLGPAARVVTVASRDARNATRFAAQFGVPTAAPDYASAAQHRDVDAVYIATPPSEHEAHAMLAIAAGKAVLIEKPFALNAGAARRIAEAAEAAGVFCMEAMWTRFLPMIARISQKIEAGDLGEIRSLQGNFMIPNRVDAATSLFDPARGGGALLHRGIYPLSLARQFLGPITGLQATGRIGDTGVDEDCVLVARHANGAVSTVTASLRSAGSNDLWIAGTRAVLHVQGPIFRPYQARLITVPARGAAGGNTGGPSGGRMQAIKESGFAQRLNQMVPGAVRALLSGHKTLRARYAGNGYHYEAAEVAACLARGQTQSALMPLEQSIQIMDMIDQARAQFS